MKRRTFLLSLALTGASPAVAKLPDREVRPPDGGGPVVVPQSWTPGPYALYPGGTVDLSQNLPPGARRGGTFSVSSGGAPLPAGVTLSPEGILSAGKKAKPGTTEGVVFVYVEPE